MSRPWRDCLRCEAPSFEATGEWVRGIAIVPVFVLPVLLGLLVFIFRFKSDSNPHILMYSLGFSRRCSGSFPEQSNKMDERSATWRQTIKLSIFITESRLENRVTAGVTEKVRSLKWPERVIRSLRTCKILHLSLRLFSNRVTIAMRNQCPVGKR